MGVWDVGPFGSDNACDFVARLERSRSTLDAVAKKAISGCNPQRCSGHQELVALGEIAARVAGRGKYPCDGCPMPERWMLAQKPLSVPLRKAMREKLEACAQSPACLYGWSKPDAKRWQTVVLSIATRI